MQKLFCVALKIMARSLKGGLFRGLEASPRLLEKSAQAKKSLTCEADEQAAFFGVSKQSAPRPPVKERRITRGSNKGSLTLDELVLDPQFINHPLYVLTRVRHFPNKGKRIPEMPLRKVFVQELSIFVSIRSYAVERRINNLWC